MSARRLVTRLVAGGFAMAALTHASPAAHATEEGAYEYIRTQCQTVSYPAAPTRKVKFCDAQYYVNATGQRRHVVTATQLSSGFAWRMSVATANKDVTNAGPITSTSATLYVTDSWSSSLSVKSQMYIKTDWDTPFAYALFRM